MKISVKINGVTIQGDPEQLAKVITILSNPQQPNNTANGTTTNGKNVKSIIKNFTFKSEDDIVTLLQQTGSLHVVFSGLNMKLRKQGIDPKKAVDTLIANGKITGRPAKGGFVISPLPR